jgi:hypothetical protein
MISRAVIEALQDLAMSCPKMTTQRQREFQEIRRWLEKRCAENDSNWQNEAERECG